MQFVPELGPRDERWPALGGYLSVETRKKRTLFAFDLKLPFVPRTMRFYSLGDKLLALFCQVFNFFFFFYTTFYIIYFKVQYKFSNVASVITSQS